MRQDLAKIADVNPRVSDREAVVPEVGVGEDQWISAPGVSSFRMILSVSGVLAEGVAAESQEDYLGETRVLSSRRAVVPTREISQ